MTTDHAAPPAIDALVEAMFDSCGQLAAVFAHMEKHRNTEPDAEPPAIVLGRLLNGILEPLASETGADDITVAARTLARATELIGEELFLVNEE